MSKKFTPPNIANRTDASLVDELGRIKQIAKYAKFMEGFLKEALYARLGKEAQQLPQGEKYAGTISVEERSRIVPDLVRAKFTPEEVAAVTETTNPVVMRITPNTIDLIELDKDLKILMMELGLDDEEY